MSALIDAKRVILKVGTSTLTHPTGHLNIRRIEHFVKVLADLKNAGKEIILVTSGAIAVGVGELGLAERPKDIPTRQACAAVGQCELMYIYDKLFSSYNHHVAQVLLTRDILDSEVKMKHVKNTFNRLLSLHVIPIVNENDTVSIDEMQGDTIGDNDTLSAIVGGLAEADLLIILSDIDGLYDKNPKECSEAKLIPRVDDITEEIRALAGDKGSKFGTGGMITKLHAAEYAMAAGFPMIIINGQNPSILYDLYDGKEAGTIFEAQPGQPSANL